jgi:hypothetical protein
MESAMILGYLKNLAFISIQRQKPSQIQATKEYKSCTKIQIYQRKKQKKGTNKARQKEKS